MNNNEEHQQWIRMVTCESSSEYVKEIRMNFRTMNQM